MNIQVNFKNHLGGDEAIVIRKLKKYKVGSIFIAKLNFWDDNLGKYKKYRVPVKLDSITSGIGVANAIRLGE